MKKLRAHCIFESYFGSVALVTRNGTVRKGVLDKIGRDSDSVEGHISLVQLLESPCSGSP